jgi:hypothetical protein
MPQERDLSNNGIDLESLYLEEKPKREEKQQNAGHWDGRIWIAAGVFGTSVGVGWGTMMVGLYGTRENDVHNSATQDAGTSMENLSNERLSQLGVQVRTATPDRTPPSVDIRRMILNSEEGDVLHIEDPNLVKMYEVSFGLASFHVSVLADEEGDAVLYIVNSACFEGEDLPEPVQKLGRIVWEMEEANITNTDVKVWEKGSGLNIGVLEGYEADRDGEVQQVDCQVPALYSGGREFLRRTVRGAVGVVRDVYDAARDEIRGQ